MTSELKIGACIHGHVVHYRYPCPDCEADVFMGHVNDEILAGFQSAAFTDEDT